LRIKKDGQLAFEFQSSNLKVTRDHFARYAGIAQILDEHPEIVDAVHADLAKTVKNTGRGRAPGRQCEYTSETVLRVLISQLIEGEDLRGIVVRIDDSVALRRFVKINDGSMMDSSALCRFKNAIRPATWKKVNLLLARAAVETGKIDGEQLRLDTTAYETNIGYPSDSKLLYDTYRVLARSLQSAREIDGDLLDGRRLHIRRVKKQHLDITRRAAKRGSRSPDLISRYKPLLAAVEGVLQLSEETAVALSGHAHAGHYSVPDTAKAELIASELENYAELGRRVVSQARRRVLHGEKVSATEKLYSIFEPHTELLKRGKAGKPIEFGHMIMIQQVRGCFITGYDVFAKRPADHSLVDPALRRHEELFGEAPSEISGDRGFHQSSDKTAALEQTIPVVSIPKNGRRNASDKERESHFAFKIAQAFRAGVEGSISYLKRALRMLRCLNKGWEHYVSTVGATIFAHNLLVLARSG
jgi:IS5 family transposase